MHIFSVFAFPPIPLRLACCCVKEDAKLSEDKAGQPSALVMSSDSKSYMDLQKPNFSLGFSPQAFSEQGGKHHLG